MYVNLFNMKDAAYVWIVREVETLIKSGQISLCSLRFRPATYSTEKSHDVIINRPISGSAPRPVY